MSTIVNQDLIKERREWLTADKRLAALKKTLPSHMTPESFANIAVNAMLKNPTLLQCEPNSFYMAMMMAAELGLAPNTQLGLSYLVPYDKSYNENGVWKKRKEVQLIIGYQGLIELAYRSGFVKEVSAACVYKGDEYMVRLGTQRQIIHVPRDQSIADEDVTHAYAVVRTVTGGMPFESLNRQQLERHRQFSASGKDAQQNGKKASGPWIEHYPSMCCKTSLKAVCKFVPKTPEISKALALEWSQDTGDVAALSEFTSTQDDMPNVDALTSSQQLAARIAADGPVEHAEGLMPGDPTDRDDCTRQEIVAHMQAQALFDPETETNRGR